MFCKLDICILAVLFFLSLNLCQVYCKTNHTMRGLVIFHRHGARLPAVEDYYAEDWPKDLKRGDLSDKGIR